MRRGSTLTHKNIEKLLLKRSKLGCIQSIDNLMAHCEGKLWVILTLCRWLWIVADHCGLSVAGCGSLWIVVGHCGSFLTLVCTVLTGSAILHE